MCRSCLSRRKFLTLSATAPLALSACDDGPNLVSQAEAAEMGEAAWAQIKSETPISRNATYRQTLDRVSSRLINAASLTDRNWEIEVFATPDANAFALPGGKIGVYEGMFDVIGSEDQLAAIVGHEIGHLQAEHPQERMSAQVATDTGISIVAFFLNLGGIEYSREIAAALGMGVQYGLLMPFNREQELEADALGLRLMDSAAYNPRQAVDLWQRMEAAGGARTPEFLATHPAPQNRIREIEAILREL
ncbi:TPR repeat-containing protein YfgC precursor [Rhodobacteraceae bacterium THAF1]|uniref:M48 family metallopeptidase n=1 Tax=Palleronia sp. THAF1 TaxID=2587842 RepID=UPI000F41AF02|nr:M48 family metallopeptidase [Palleronia sp. THAF1]QFU09840.1 TPR repeat-containing protein YfgC precursor [Palleronia sp. THAF1]VDC17257.1 TPR repeat-containing protein YfgC precursor [Rhodobacteraceae bacterium THAF1]